MQSWLRNEQRNEGFAVQIHKSIQLFRPYFSLQKCYFCHPARLSGNTGLSREGLLLGKADQNYVTSVKESVPLETASSYKTSGFFSLLFTPNF